MGQIRILPGREATVAYDVAVREEERPGRPRAHAEFHPRTGRLLEHPRRFAQEAPGRDQRAGAILLAGKGEE